MKLRCVSYWWWTSKMVAVSAFDGCVFWKLVPVGGHRGRRRHSSGGSQLLSWSLGLPGLNLWKRVMGLGEGIAESCTPVLSDPPLLSLPCPLFLLTTLLTCPPSLSLFPYYKNFCDNGLFPQEHFHSLSEYWERLLKFTVFCFQTFSRMTGVLFPLCVLIKWHTAVWRWTPYCQIQT